MIKVIAFDLGGVFFAEGKSVAVKKLSKEHGYEEGVVLKLLKCHKSLELRKGLISDEEFWNWVQEQLPSGYDAQLIKKEWYDGYVLDTDILNLVKSLKGNYKLMVFSGNIKSRVEYLDKKYDFRKYFDVEVYSHDFHLCKPEREFVEAMIKESGVNPDEIAYVEDDERSSAEALNFGVKAIIYSRGKIRELKEELRKLGVTC